MGGPGITRPGGEEISVSVFVIRKEGAGFTFITHIVHLDYSFKSFASCQILARQALSEELNDKNEALRQLHMEVQRQVSKLCVTWTSERERLGYPQQSRA